MTSVRSTMVSAARAARYRADGVWSDRGLADGVEAAAAQRPGAIAVADNDRRVTFAELERGIVAGVSLLRASGARRGDAAVLVAGNTIDGVIAYHALLRTDTTAVLLDRRCGPADVGHALAVAGGRGPVIVPAAERERLLRGAESEVLLLEHFGAPDLSASAWSEPDRDCPAVVLFT